MALPLWGDRPVALGNTAYAYRWAHHGDRGPAPWAVITHGAVAALPDPAAHYRRRGATPEQAALLGERIARSMCRSRWGVPEHERAHPIAIVGAPGVPAVEVPMLATLATLALEAALHLAGEVVPGKLPVTCLVRAVEDPGEARRAKRWAGLLATRLDHPCFLEAEIRALLLEAARALIDPREDIVDWIARDRDPSVRIRKPHGHPGLPLIVAPCAVASASAARALQDPEPFELARALGASALPFAIGPPPGPAH